MWSKESIQEEIREWAEAIARANHYGQKIARYLKNLLKDVIKNEDGPVGVTLGGYEVGPETITLGWGCGRLVGAEEKYPFILHSLLGELNDLVKEMAEKHGQTIGLTEIEYSPNFQSYLYLKEGEFIEACKALKEVFIGFPNGERSFWKGVITDALHSMKEWKVRVSVHYIGNGGVPVYSIEGKIRDISNSRLKQIVNRILENP